MTGTEIIEITVNGVPRQVAAGAGILDLLAQLDIDRERVAIEFDREILKREHWSGTRLHPGARLEIVQFVGGG